MSRGVPVLFTGGGRQDGMITDGTDGYLVPLGPLENMVLPSSKLLRLLEELTLTIEMGHKACDEIDRRYDEIAASIFFFEMWGRADNELALS